MAEELLEANQDVVEDVVAVEEAPSEQLTQEQVLAMIEDVKAEAKMEAARQAEEAFTRSQSLIDKNIARERATWQSQYETLQSRYGEFAIAQGADPDALETLDRQTKTEVEMQELRRQAQAYQELKAQTEAEKERAAFILEQCRKYKIDPSDPRLNKSDPYAFVESILVVQNERLARRTKDAEREDKKKDLEALREAGNLDVTGGGAAMAPPAWSTASLMPGSEESAISGHIMHYFGTLKPEELGQKIQKVQQLMKSDPRWAGKPKATARRVWDMEQGY